MNSIIVDKNNPKTKQEIHIGNIIIEEIPFFYHYFIPSVVGGGGGAAAAHKIQLIIQDIDEDVDFYNSSNNNNMEIVELQPIPTECEGIHLYTCFMRECVPDINDQYNYLLHSFNILTDLGIVYLSDNITIQNITHLPLLTSFHHSLYVNEINNINDLVEKINLIDDTYNYLWCCDLMFIVLAVRAGADVGGAPAFIENVCLKFTETNLFIRNLDKKYKKKVYNSLVEYYVSLFNDENNQNILDILFDIFKKSWKKWNKFTLHVCFENILHSFLNNNNNNNIAVDKINVFHKKIQNFIFDCCFL